MFAQNKKILFVFLAQNDEYFILNMRGSQNEKYCHIQGASIKPVDGFCCKNKIIF